MFLDINFGFRGLIVTNAHVVDGCKRMTLKSGAELEIIDVAKGDDLALLRGANSIRPLTIRDTRSVRLAEDVLIAGFPLAGILSSGINVTVGTVSAQAGMGDDRRRFQFTAPVQPGNSGGPVLDAESKKLVAIHNGGHAGNALPDGGFDALNWAPVLDLPSLRAFLPDAGP